MRTGGSRATDKGLPGWVPDDVRAYLTHTLTGRSIRAMARDAGLEPSTISRRVRRVETLRDDALVDMALANLERSFQRSKAAARGAMEKAQLTHANHPEPITETEFDDEAMRVLRRLCEQGAVLALAPNMDTAVVVREAGDGPALRTAMVHRNVAEAMALKAWIAPSGTGRVLRYRITPTGRAMLRESVARAESRRARETGTLDEGQGDRGTGTAGARRGARYNLAESPLVTLARRRDRDNTPFLSDALVAAGERLREDFELAQTGPRVSQNWEGLLTGRVDPGGSCADRPAATDARGRVERALAALGPGLGDVALRCCCYLEGLEATERNMGWSARSGKIVLRIALQRLKMHYDAERDAWSPLIGAEEMRKRRA